MEGISKSDGHPEDRGLDIRTYLHRHGVRASGTGVEPRGHSNSDIRGWSSIFLSVGSEALLELCLGWELALN